MTYYIPVICNICHTYSSETCICKKEEYSLTPENLEKLEKMKNCNHCNCSLSNEMYFSNSKVYCVNCINLYRKHR